MAYIENKKNKSNSLNDTTNKNDNIKSIILFVGHINHGKTTIIQTLINKKLTEKYNITQDLGVYKHENVIYIDTPGHKVLRSIRTGFFNIFNIIFLVISLKEGIEKETLDIIYNLENFVNKKIYIIFTHSDVVTDPKQKALDNLEQIYSISLIVSDMIQDYYVVSSKTMDGLSNLKNKILNLKDIYQINDENQLGIIINIIRIKNTKFYTILLNNGSLKTSSDIYVLNNNIFYKLRIKRILNVGLNKKSINNVNARDLVYIEFSKSNNNADFFNLNTHFLPIFKNKFTIIEENKIEENQSEEKKNKIKKKSNVFNTKKIKIYKKKKKIGSGEIHTNDSNLAKIDLVIVSQSILVRKAIQDFIFDLNLNIDKIYQLDKSDFFKHQLENHNRVFINIVDSLDHLSEKEKNKFKFFNQLKILVFNDYVVESNSVISFDHISKLQKYIIKLTIQTFKKFTTTLKVLKIFKIEQNNCKEVVIGCKVEYGTIKIKDEVVLSNGLSATVMSLKCGKKFVESASLNQEIGIIFDKNFASIKEKDILQIVNKNINKFIQL